MRKMLGLATALAVLVGLSACGEKKETVGGASGHSQALSLMLDWFPNADHVGLYTALANGDFERAGLNVKVRVPSDPSAPLKLLAAGKVDMAITYEPELMLARDQNQPVASIAAIVQQPLTSIVSVGSKHIRGVSDLRGKTVGDAGIPYQHAYLTTILAHAGIPQNKVKEINVGSNLLPAMLSGHVDATLGAYWNYEAVQLAQMGRRPGVIRMNQVGVPTYDELVLAVRTSTLTQHGDEIRRFVQALARGYRDARANPKAAVRDLVSQSPGLDPKLQLASVKATLPAFFPADPTRPWGYQDQTRWNAYGDWMLTHHLISNPGAVANASTNQALAGQGV